MFVVAYFDFDIKTLLHTSNSANLDKYNDCSVGVFTVLVHTTHSVNINRLFCVYRRHTKSFELCSNQWRFFWESNRKIDESVRDFVHFWDPKIRVVCPSKHWCILWAIIFFQHIYTSIPGHGGLKQGMS